jgi:hypothetical protein
MNVDICTEASSIAFPTEIDIITNATTLTLDISGLDWSCVQYNKDIGGTYNFTSDIIGIITARNIGSGSMSTIINVDVVVAQEEIQSINSLSDINVDNGTEQSVISFPSELEIVTNGITRLLDISGLAWSCVNYNKNIGATYVFTTDISGILTDMKINNGDLATAISINVVVAQTTSVDNPKLEKVKVFPNPVKDLLKIDNTKECIIELLDNTGRKLLEQKSMGSIEIDISDNNRGAYLLKFNYPNETIIKRIIKE